MALSVVFCVLLLTVPPGYHEVFIDLPVASPSPSLPRRVHQLVIDARGRAWMDGKALANQSELLDALTAQQAENPIPDLQIEADPDVRYETFLEVLAVTKRARVYRLCLDMNPARQTKAHLAAAKQHCEPPPIPIDFIAG
jgi:biopolymer transport protein ExbD